MSEQVPKLHYNVVLVIQAACCEDSHEPFAVGRGQLKCDVTRAETRFCLSAKRASPFKSAGLLFSRLLAAEVCASAVVMLVTPCSEVV